MKKAKKTKASVKNSGLSGKDQMMIERTLVLIKPDGVQRGIIGKIITRFEDAGYKLVGLKMVWCDEAFAKNHYTEDISIRRGEHIRRQLVNMFLDGPVVAFCLEGVNAIEGVRKMVGSTEPRTAPPGTIRGDFAHVSYAYANEKDVAVKNIIHASSDLNDARREVKLWFGDKELHSYRTVHDMHIFN